MGEAGVEAPPALMVVAKPFGRGMLENWLSLPLLPTGCKLGAETGRGSMINCQILNRSL